MSSPRAPGPELTPNSAAEAEYLLKLFITGQTTRSTLALQNIRRICDSNLEGRYRLEVVDIYQHPELASEAQIVAAPTLLKVSPEPPRRIIGDLSDADKVLSALDLKPRGAAFGS
jgi:circadian clock protein KaiB